MPLNELSIAVVGARFPNPKRKGKPTGNREVEILMLEPGAVVNLVPEPENPADKSAIAVYATTGVQIGYVSADRTNVIWRAWHDAREVRAIFQQRTEYGAVVRVAFDREPVLPPAVVEQPDLAEVAVRDPEEGDGFWPDYIPPDE